MFIYIAQGFAHCHFFWMLLRYSWSRWRTTHLGVSWQIHRVTSRASVSSCHHQNRNLVPIVISESAVAQFCGTQASWFSTFGPKSTLLSMFTTMWHRTPSLLNLEFDPKGKWTFQINVMHQSRLSNKALAPGSVCSSIKLVPVFQYHLCRHWFTSSVLHWNHCFRGI